MKARLLKQIRREFKIEYFNSGKQIYLKCYDYNTMHFCDNIKECISVFSFYGSRWLQSEIIKIKNKNTCR